MAKLDDRRFSKKAYLFLSNEVPAWKNAAKAAKKQPEAALKDFVGPNVAVKREDWTSGSTPHLEVLRKRLKKWTKTYRKNFEYEFPVDQFIHAIDQFDDEHVSVYEFASLIDLSMSDAERILDGHYFNHNSFPKLLNYVPASNAKLDADRFGGIYNVFLERGDLVIDGRMRVRYHLGSMIRVKLNLRRYHFEKIGKAYHEYDGFLKLDEPSGYGIFQERDNVKRPDFFHFNLEVSGAVPSRENPWFGLYLSSTKGEHPSPVSGRICAFREHDNDWDDESLANFMHNPDDNQTADFDEFLKETLSSRGS